MNQAILKLTSYIQELEEKTKFDTLEEKAEHIGLIIQIKDAIGQLELCEKHGISGGSLVNELPETGTTHHQFVVAHQNESTNPEIGRRSCSMVAKFDFLRVTWLLENR